jgi:3-oxoacyl-[acyl-carrier protein] reductase
VSYERGTDLQGKVALVVGGARNIGRGVALALAAGGASVVVNTRSSEEAATETVGLIEKDGGIAICHIADVTDPEAVTAMVSAAVERFGRLDILVNNQTLRASSPIEQLSYDEWRRVLGTILDGSFLCARAVVPHMVEAGGGAIVMMGGLHGFIGGRNSAHVSAAKNGLVGLTKALARELADRHITVNCVHPFLIDTERVDGAPRASDHPPPVGRLGTVEEVAGMVRLLCGPEGGYITGQSIHMNGGSFMP